MQVSFKLSALKLLVRHWIDINSNVILPVVTYRLRRRKTNYKYRELIVVCIKCIFSMMITPGKFNYKDRKWSINTVYKDIKRGLS
jgi:hypothetical protein